jgi:hypothetical protein
LRLVAPRGPSLVRRVAQSELHSPLTEHSTQLETTAKRLDIATERGNPRIRLMLDMRDRTLRSSKLVGKLDLG